MKNKKRIIGLIGGMGPFASSYFYNLLLKKSVIDYGAKDNDDYPEIIIDSVPVPDFISDLKKVKEAEKMLLKRVSRLNKVGATYIAMVCNTGHLLYPSLSRVSDVPFLSMIDLVAVKVKQQGSKTVGVLATPTTVKFDLYGKALSKVGIKVVYPDLIIQKKHEELIRKLIEGEKDRKLMSDFIGSTKNFIKNNNLDCLVLGCTELPLIFPREKFKQNIIDCTQVLADELLVRYYKSI